MKIGMNTDSLGTLSLEAVLDAAVELGLDCVEFAAGNWSSAPHIDIDALLADAAACDAFTAKVRERGLTVSALTWDRQFAASRQRTGARRGHPQIDQAGAADRRRPHHPDVGVSRRARRQAPNWIPSPGRRRRPKFWNGNRTDGHPLLAEARGLCERQGHSRHLVSNCTAARTSTTSRASSGCARRRGRARSV